jgi:hypothetical protein
MECVWNADACKRQKSNSRRLDVRGLLWLVAVEGESKMEKSTPFGINLMRSQVSYQAAQVLKLT